MDGVYYHHCPHCLSGYTSLEVDFVHKIHSADPDAHGSSAAVWGAVLEVVAADKIRSYFHSNYRKDCCGSGS